VAKVKEGVYAAMNEDFNTPIAIANLFEAARLINLIHDGKEQANEIDLQDLKSLYENMVYGVLGLKDESSGGTDKMDELMQVVLKIRSEAKLRKDFYTSDQIRDQLKQIGIEIKDGKEGTSYNLD
jgi:cysteinyl-tRNA synthetase